jgi:hypothetical protein
VLSGGVASGNTIFAGSQVISSGGTLSGDQISGGLVVLEAGAVVSGGIALGGSGTLEIVGSAMPSATISGFTIGDIIDLVSVASGSGGSAALISGNVIGRGGGRLDLSVAARSVEELLGHPIRAVFGRDQRHRHRARQGGLGLTSGQTLTISSGRRAAHSLRRL